MGSSLICPYCNLPNVICKLNDKKLIQPITATPDDLREIRFSSLSLTPRYMKCYMYATGQYDQQNHRFIDYKRLTIRQRRDIYLSLPMCVWTPYDLSSRNFFVQTVINANIQQLPMESEYLTILKNGI